MRAFDQAKQNIHAHVNANLQQHTCGIAPDPEKTIAELKRLQATARKAKAAYDKAQADMEAARPEEDKQAKRVEQENRAENENLLAAIAKIEL